MNKQNNFIGLNGEFVPTIPMTKKSFSITHLEEMKIYFTHTAKFNKKQKELRIKAIDDLIHTKEIFDSILAD